MRGFLLCALLVLPMVVCLSDGDSDPASKMGTNSDNVPELRFAEAGNDYDKLYDEVSQEETSGNDEGSPTGSLVKLVLCQGLCQQ